MDDEGVCPYLDNGLNSLSYGSGISVRAIIKSLELSIPTGRGHATVIYGQGDQTLG